MRFASARCGILVLMFCIGALALCGCFVSLNPISDEEQWQRAVEDTASLFLGQEAPQTPISLPEAVARAVKYNLDHKLSLMEAAFHVGQLDVANLSMLPRLAVNAGYSWRSNEAASQSMSYRTRTQSLEPSFSTEMTHVTSDLSLSWTLLDFGLSYFQARQQADRVMIMQERRRRIVNN
ncbi:MAG: TolC family protein, partial [Planctomycetes bacterium]|nr:TolC family protein [Planctomycetota bacterium]